jgi:methyl-accepting chemotaxis protein
MGRFDLLHSHPGHRARQLRWVVPLAVLLLVAVVATLAVQYRVSSQEIGTEFFRAHKTIHHTGELLVRGTLVGGAVLVVLVSALALWALRMTHRIVRPVHTLHRALDALAGGDLGVRVELDRTDEFGDLADALNRLADEFATALGRIHALVDGLVAASPGGTERAVVQELDRTMEFFRLEPRRTIRARDV